MMAPCIREGALSRLSFIEDVLSSIPNGATLAPGYEGVRLRRLAVDGIPFSDHFPEPPRSGAEAYVVLHPANVESGVTFLESLLGGAPADPLRPGRIGLGFCGLCADSSCGHLLAGRLTIDTARVHWTEIGVELEHFGRFAADGSTIPPPEWWTPQPFVPAVSYTFDRVSYEEAVHAELRLIKDPRWSVESA